MDIVKKHWKSMLFMVGFLVVVILMIVQFQSSKALNAVEEKETVSESKETEKELAEVDTTKDATEGENTTLSIARVKEVVDAKTIKVTVDHENAIVKLIGIEIPDKGTTYYDESKAFVEQLFSTKKYIFLEYDAVRYDEDSNLLAYVWLSSRVTSNSDEMLEKFNLNYILLKKGYCNAIEHSSDSDATSTDDTNKKSDAYNTSMESTFVNVSEEAKVNGDGFWADVDFFAIMGVHQDSKYKAYSGDAPAEVEAMYEEADREEDKEQYNTTPSTNSNTQGEDNLPEDTQKSRTLIEGTPEWYQEWGDSNAY